MNRLVASHQLQGSLEASNTSVTTSAGAGAVSVAQLAMLRKVSEECRGKMAAIYATTCISQLTANIKMKEASTSCGSGRCNRRSSVSQQKQLEEV